MIKSIKLRLWLTIFATLVISLGTLLSLSYLSIKQRFMDYATQQILDRLEPLEQAIVAVYAESLTLKTFEENPARWNQLRDATYRQYLQDQNRRTPEILAPKTQDWSERESLEKKLQPDQRAFFQHLVLFDQEKKIIGGRLKEDAQYILRGLVYENSTIAYIGYIKPNAFLRTVDKLFVDQQIKTFALLSVAMVFASLLVTLLVSRWLVKPLSLLAHSAKKVSAGDFSVRVSSTANDELGKLCRDFDDMVHSLERNEALRKQWVADISHEMRTPLSVLKAQIEAMEDGIRAVNADNIQLLKRNVDSLSSIVEDLYDLSLADIGALTLHKSQINLNDLVNEIVTEFQQKFGNKNITLTVQENSLPQMLHADSKRLKQALVNLLENSYRYTFENGRVNIAIAGDEQKITLTIEDSEPGVADDMLEKIYERLFRLEASRNRETGGAGLGLSICKGITEAHNGQIVASHSPLGGLKQTLTFYKEGFA